MLNHMTKKKEVIGRKYSDHRTLAFSIILRRKTVEDGEKEKIRFIKNEESVKKKSDTMWLTPIEVLNTNI